MVSSTFAIEILKNSLEIYSPSRSETKLANYLKEVCLDLGFERANIDSVGNIIAIKGTGDPEYYFAGIWIQFQGSFQYGWMVTIYMVEVLLMQKLL